MTALLMGGMLSVPLGKAVHGEEEPPRTLSPTELERVLQSEQERIGIIEKISAPTLAIFGPDGGGGGSGVIISPDGYALTNFHVTKPCGDYLRCGMNDGSLVDAVIVGVDPTGDVALIQLLGRSDFPTAELGDSDQLQVGEWCYVVGNPFLLATDFKPTVTFGIISGIHRYQYPSGTLLEYADCIQTDASINPGNSGGPLFNAEGQLIGINGRGSFEKRGRVNVGVGYAISINQIKKFYGYLRSGRIVDHATLGFTVSTDEAGRVIVTDILETSDAYRRGVRYEDEIVALGGRPVRSANELKNILGTYPRGWIVPLSIRQEGERRELKVRLAGVHSREQLVKLVQSAPVEMPGPEAPHPKDRDGKGEKLPSDGRRPDEGRPDRRPKIQPELPKILQPSKEKVALPSDVAARLETRRGYANYFYNRQNLDRIWDGYQARVNLLDENGEWQLRGVKEGAVPFELVLQDDQSFADMTTERYRVDLTADLDDQLEPEGSGGMLLALSMWRRLLTIGPKKFGEVFYLGTVPHEGDPNNMLDVIVATHNAIEVHFQFDSESAELRRMELFPTIQTDPCVVEFGPSVEMNGFLMPSALRILRGDDPFTTLKLQSFRLIPQEGREL